MTDMNINGQMQKLAEYAVSAASEKFGRSLDYTEASLDSFDTLLQMAYDRFKLLTSEKKLTEEAVQKTTRIWGSYIGELIRRSFGGEWSVERGQMVLLVKNIKISPFSYIKTRITSQPNYKPQMYLEGIKNHLTELNNAVPQPSQVNIFPEIVYEQGKVESGKYQQHLTPTKQKYAPSSNQANKYLKIGLIVLPLFICFVAAVVVVIVLLSRNSSNPLSVVRALPTLTNTPRPTPTIYVSPTPSLYLKDPIDYFPLPAGMPDFDVDYSSPPGPVQTTNGKGYSITYRNPDARYSKVTSITFYIFVFNSESDADSFYNRLIANASDKAYDMDMKEPEINKSALSTGLQTSNGINLVTCTSYWRVKNLVINVFAITQYISGYSGMDADAFGKSFIANTIELQYLVLGRIRGQ